MFECDLKGTVIFSPIPLDLLHNPTPRCGQTRVFESIKTVNKVRSCDGPRTIRPEQFVPVEIYAIAQNKRVGETAVIIGPILGDIGSNV